MTKKEAYKKELVHILTKIKDKRTLMKFLEDLFTPREFNDIASRIQIVKQLNKGIPQRQIAKNLGIGIATVTRGSRQRQQKGGGFSKVLK